MAKRPSDEKVRRTMEEIVGKDPVHRPPVPAKPIETNHQNAPKVKRAAEKKEDPRRRTDQELLGKTTDFEIEDSEPVAKFSRRKPVALSLPEMDSSSTDSVDDSGKAATFFPTHRPKTPILYMMDDNQESAEAFRLRAMQTVIGRSRGDILIGNDAHVSERHAEIRRDLKGDQFSWILNDLKSTNGSYVQILKQNLVEGDCMLLGSRYFRFSQVDTDSITDLRYALVQYAFASGEKRQIYMLDRKKENLVGNRQSCSQGKIWDDKFLDHEHAKIVCDHNNQWSIEDLGSVNGTWIKFHSLTLTDGISFQLGGQRFTFCTEE